MAENSTPDAPPGFLTFGAPPGPLSTGWLPPPPVDEPSELLPDITTLPQPAPEPVIQPGFAELHPGHATGPAPLPGGIGAGFGVDTDGARAAITSLDQVIDRLTGTLRYLERHGRIEPPGADHVSARIASNTTLMFDNARVYVQVLRDRVEAARHALQAQTNAYEHADDANRFRT